MDRNLNRSKKEAPMVCNQIAVITAALCTLTECLDCADHEQSSQSPVDILDIFLVGSVPYSRFGKLFNKLVKMLWVPYVPFELDRDTMYRDLVPFYLQLSEREMELFRSGTSMVV